MKSKKRNHNAFRKPNKPCSIFQIYTGQNHVVHPYLWTEACIAAIRILAVELTGRRVMYTLVNVNAR